MSWKATAWAKETTGHGSYAQKLLLMVLADYHNAEQDIAYPSIRELARTCEMSPRTVRWCIKRLEDMGFISTIQKGNQYQRTEYVLHFASTQAQALTVKSAPHVFAQAHEGAMSGEAMVAPAHEGAMSGIVQGQRDVSEGASPVTTNLNEPQREPQISLLGMGTGDELWPDWYATLYAIPGFKVPLSHAKEWLEKKGITEDYAETTAYALKGRWNGKKYKDAWATFQNWVKRPPLQKRSDNGTGTHRQRDGTPGGPPEEDLTEYEKEFKRLERFQAGAKPD